MIKLRPLLSGCALAACLAPAAVAQSPYGQRPQAYPGYVDPFAPLGDADRLAQQLRQLAANPNDLYALLNAAKLSLKVGDTDAAAALYTRAERVNPMNPQVKAGMARLLVQSGRPGAALRRFQDAERAGASLADFGPDRALAYDLVGEQQRAQREYRALLRQGSDDETVRRYALSLGISGLKEPALALLEPLNRRSDRGAWRARAFVLAMTGDRRGAERIATTMMPAGMAEGLDPFFDRLPRLSASERAFAVSFGETRASPTRLADARLVPPLPALSPEPNPFPQGRAQVQLAARDDEDDGRRKKKRKSKRDRDEPVRSARHAYEAPLPPPPAPTAVQLAGLSASRAGSRTFMPSASGGKVTVLPPPADAYRGTTAQVAAASANPADQDEPDFAVSAVAALADRGRSNAAGAGERAGSRATVPPRATPPPTALASARPSTPGPGNPVSGPRLTGSVPGVGASNFSLAAAPPATPPPAPLPTPTQPTVAQPSQTPTPTGSPPATALASNSVAPSAIRAAPPTGASQSAAALANATIAPATPALSAAPSAVVPEAPAQPGAALASAAPAPGFSGLVQTGPGAASDPALAAADVASGEVGVAASTATLAAAPTAGPVEGGAGATLAAALPTTSPAITAGPPATAAITAATGAPPPPRDAHGDDVLAAIVAGITVPERDAAAASATQPPAAAAIETPGAQAPATPVPAAQAPAIAAPAVRPAAPPPAPKLLANIDKRAEAAERAAAKPDPTLPKKDARGRFVDAKGKPLLDARGQPMGPKGAAAWLAAQNAGGTAKDKPDPTLPKKDARGRFVDAKGKPLLDDRGRPMGPKAAAAWLAAQTAGETAKDKPDPTLPKKDARGRFVDAKGKPLLDERGRPMGPKAAAAWQTAQNDRDDDKAPAKGKADASLPKKDARGRFVDDKGKPLLDARGRPMDARAAAAWKVAEAKKKPEPAAKGEPQRFWVQVAGGANQATLGKEWARVSAATPSLKGKAGWTTPLRATHRVLTGPFKSSAEAMAMVNQLKKEGLSAFMFTSDAGQKVARLGAK